ncbi:MAG: hypothetical protein MUE41_09390 [Gemmatimonadaceae bacterium]|nr:hypothetical protein [Gemmatimonadaceae bacterium]
MVLASATVISLALLVGRLLPALAAHAASLDDAIATERRTIARLQLDIVTVTSRTAPHGHARALVDSLQFAGENAAARGVSATMRALSALADSLHVTLEQLRGDRAPARDRAACSGGVCTSRMPLLATFRGDDVALLAGMRALEAGAVPMLRVREAQFEVAETGATRQLRARLSLELLVHRLARELHR